MKMTWLASATDSASHVMHVAPAVGKHQVRRGGALLVTRVLVRARADYVPHRRGVGDHQGMRVEVSHVEVSHGRTLASHRHPSPAWPGACTADGVPFQQEDSSQSSSRVQDILPCHPAFAESLEKPPGLGEGRGLRRERVYLALADLSENVGE